MTTRWTLLALVGLGALGCGEKDSSGFDTNSFEETDCSGAEGAEAVVCAAENFLATLDADELSAVGYDFDDATSKTRWSNLPPGAVTRNGLTQEELSAESLEALHAFAAVLLSADGYEDFVGVLAADDYLGEQGGGGGGPGGGSYASSNYIIAFFGTPSTSASWMVQLGGHHMAYNVTYVAGEGFPTPNHLGAEPKGSFTLDSESYDPVSAEGQAFVDLFAALSSTELEAAYLSGQSFGDVLLGPVEYETGSLSAVSYPTGSSRGGVQVSELDDAAQALVTAVIEQWVADFDASISDPLLAEYTSAEAYADTVVAWAGDASGPDIDVSGTYFRVDGPRVWIEVACQAGVVIQGQTHFHTIYRDKEMDYGGAL
ncbi:MAG: DUF3500 domain-containing protein [Alphaproteobacteria bacterium]|nr:DUF3500 domain-containing protein [Alphaproteobacteria bacterium]